MTFNKESDDDDDDDDHFVPSYLVIYGMIAKIYLVSVSQSGTVIIHRNRL